MRHSHNRGSHKGRMPMQSAPFKVLPEAVRPKWAWQIGNA
jgi:hypothetical protein